jgi:TfoX/Sxy family transcriptional regulator of competence genes
MAYNKQLADQIRICLENQTDVEEKKMMGGLTFMVNGKMCVGVVKDELMCRINPEMDEIVLEKIGCRRMDFTSKPMKGYVFVDEMGINKENPLSYWVNLSLDFNAIAKASKKKSKQ